MIWKPIGDAARDVANKIKQNEAAGGNEARRYRCAFPGCHRSTTQHPYLVGWCNLVSWGPGIPDGFYCKPHGDALEALCENGELDRIQGGVR